MNLFLCHGNIEWRALARYKSGWILRNNPHIHLSTMSNPPPPNPPAPNPTALDLKNIQGDILSGLPKKTQLYIFIDIVDVKQFRHRLLAFIPKIKTVAEVLEDRKKIEEHKRKKVPGWHKIVGVNISISHKGFVKLGIDDKSLATAGPTDPYIIGQEQDALKNLNDPKSADGKTPAWDPHFLKDIHAVILISGDSHGTTNEKKAEIDEIFGSSIKEVITIRGDVRPGDEDGHEHFGFQDGISNPYVTGFDKVADQEPGPKPVDPGVIVTGKTGDPGIGIREDWSKEGSFAVFRWLSQDVLLFDEFLKNNPLTEDGNKKHLTKAEGSELLGARMVGRWKSGAPIDISPFKDDPKLAKDKKRNNDFEFAGEIASSLKCPFAAHVRKTNPRDDLEVPPPPRPSIPVGPHRIMRRGIQFGPEVTPVEKEKGKTLHDRGLLFNCYQTSIAKGFQFLQQAWADNDNFPPFSGNISPPPGLDPLIGQGIRTMIGLDPVQPLKPTSFGVFITPKGGEYFFSPSISGLKSKIAQAC